jgi:hypothetical protein
VLECCTAPSDGWRGGAPASCLCAQLDEQLLLRERAKYRRQTQLYKEWNERVYETIQAQIDEQLASLRTEDLSTRRRQLMEEYIRVSTQKRYGLYRDIIIESEYDPLVAHQKLLKYKMSDQQDPLKLEINNADLGKAKRALGTRTPARHRGARQRLPSSRVGR